MSITLILPDKRELTVAKGTTPLEVAKSIAPSLAKSMLYAVCEGKDIDARAKLISGGHFTIITQKNTAEALAFMRHDTAHVLGQALQELYPGTKFAIGPAVENGFYYDVECPVQLSTDDLPTIEQRMKEIIDRKIPITRHVWTRAHALAYFTKKGEVYKTEILNDLPETAEITVYEQGDFLDLCRGPHSDSTAHASKAFTLTKIAGAYWRGDSTRTMLQRIYGVAFHTQVDLDAYRTMIDEAQKRDHRKLGKEMSLFHMQEEAPGSVFWHPNGWVIYNEIQRYMQLRQQQEGYVEVKTPQVLDKVFWEQSGHWDKYRENMFIVSNVEDKEYALKPMNCPCHVQIFKQGTRSYKDLPIRMAEFGACNRNEPSGALHGLMRVRAFTQDDAHIFCLENQIASETVLFCTFLHAVYKDFFGADTEVIVKFSDRPEKRIGSDAAWDKAEAALLSAAKEANLTIIENKGEGAFYGPKLEFVLKDSIGRDWQLGTLQVDFNLPERLNANYIDSAGEKQHPVMLHRAILGSFERFIGILIEHYAGKLPLWLAPVQVVLATVTSNADTYAQAVKDEMERKGIRVFLDSRNEKIPYKIREHSLQKVPIIAIIGEKESTDNTLTLRRLGQEKQETLSIHDTIAKLLEEIRHKSVNH